MEDFVIDVPQVKDRFGTCRGVKDEVPNVLFRLIVGPAQRFALVAYVPDDAPSGDRLGLHGCRLYAGHPVSLPKAYVIHIIPACDA